MHGNKSLVRQRNRLVSAVLVVLCGFVGLGQDIEMVIDSARAGDQEAVNTLRAMAEQGNPDAQYYLGSLFAAGDEILGDAVEVFSWNMSAAEQGHVGAMINVGNLYALGQGVPEDYKSAYVWVDLAAARATGETLDLAVRNREVSGEFLTDGEIEDAKERFRVLDSRIPR